MTSPVGPRSFELSADDGSELTVHDVVDDRHPDLARVVADMHRRAFPEHEFAAEAIVADAALPSARGHLVAHQWLLMRNGEPVGYSLADSNLSRRVAPIHFLAVEPAVRLVTVGGVRIGGWFLHDSLRQYRLDAGDDGLGCVAETPDYKLPIFRQYGWQVLPVPYLEPIHGWRWRVDGLDTRQVALIWLPPDAARVDDAEPPAEVGRAAAAAFLLDKYGVDPSIDWVAALVGDRPAVS